MEGYSELSGYLGDGGDFSLGGYLGGPGVQPGGGGNVSNTLLQPLPMNDVVVTAAQSTTTQVRPQRRFAPLRIAVASTLGIWFKITRIDVGQENQLVAAGTIYCELMSEVMGGMALKGTPAYVGNEITLGLTNRDAANSRTFNATFYGNTFES